MNWILTLCIVMTVPTALWVALERWRRRQRTFRFRDGKCRPNTSAARPSRMPCIKDRYSARKVPEELDAIVVGSGMGGLSTAACLGKCGWRVLVLEQHDVAGGCTHTFEEHGVEFDTGTHYLGHFDRIHQSYFDWITGGYGCIQWDDMSRVENNYTYDVIRLDHDQDTLLPNNIDKAQRHERLYPLCAGEKCFIYQLSLQFTNLADQEAIYQYLRLVRRVAKQYDWFFALKALHPRWLGSILVRLALWVDRCILGRNYFVKTAEHVLKHEVGISNNQLLVNVLCGQWGDYGLPPDRVPFFVHAVIVNHYLDGARFPRGGSNCLAEALVHTIETGGGGRVLVQASIKNILVENGQAVGVRLDNGDEWRAPIVISGVGFANTRSLVPASALPPSWIGFEQRVDAKESGSMVYLFVSLNGTPDELELPTYNVWTWPGANNKTPHSSAIEKSMRTYGMIEHDEKEPQQPPTTFIAFPCAKDSAWSERYPGKSNALVLTMTKYEYFSKWDTDGTSSQHRNSPEYEAKKKEWEQWLMKELQRQFPQLAKPGVVRGCTVGTPLTFNNYIRSRHGEVYGLDMGMWRFTPPAFDTLRPETPIPGLYLTGQDILMLGISGAMMSGVITANAILGYGNVIEGVMTRDLLTDATSRQCK